MIEWQEGRREGWREEEAEGESGVRLVREV